MQTLDENTLVTLYATEALLLLAAIALLLRRRGSGIHAADLLAAALFAWIWFRHAIVSEPTVDIRYDELAQSAMLYIALRILLSSDRYYTALLLTLLFLFGIHEAWIGFRQVYGLTYSNHGMFRITGTLFNPGPYAGFLAPLSLCAAAWIMCMRKTVARILRSRRLWLRPNILLRCTIPYALGWGCAVSTAVILPATMSRAAWLAVLAGGLLLALIEFRIGGRLWLKYKRRPFHTGISAVAALALTSLLAVGIYHDDARVVVVAERETTRAGTVPVRYRYGYGFRRVRYRYRTYRTTYVRDGPDRYRTYRTTVRYRYRYGTVRYRTVRYGTGTGTVPYGTVTVNRYRYR